MPKVVDHDLYRKELIEKCFELFCRKGYSSVTMREIAREIGVSTGTLYHYFPSKENIMEEMIEVKREDNVSEYREIMSADIALDEKLEMVSAFWNNSKEVYQNTMLLAIDLMRNGNENNERLFMDFSDYYTEAMTHNFDVSPQLARTLYIYFLGLTFHSLLTPNHISYEDHVSFISTILGTIMKDREENTKESRNKLIDLVFSLFRHKTIKN